MDENSILDGIFNWIFTYIFTPIFNALGSFFSLILSTTPSRIIFALLFMNLLGFFLMYHDKKVAQKNGKIRQEFAKEKNIDPEYLTKEEEKELNKQLQRRTPESTLLLISALFGSVGILGGMYKFRHKTQKKKFTIGVPAIIVIHVIFVIWTIISFATTAKAGF